MIHPSSKAHKVVRYISYKIIIFMIRSTIATDAKKARGGTNYTYITTTALIDI